MGWRLGAVLALLGAAAAILHTANVVESTVNPVSLFALPTTIGTWTSTEGVPEDILPLDPSEKLSVRRTYRRESQVAWVSVALFVGEKDKTHQASINKIYPQRSVSLIERVPVVVSLGASPEASVGIAAVLVHQESGNLLVAYWRQIGSRLFANEYLFRLAFMRELLFERRSDTLLVRVAAPAGQDLSATQAQAVVSELGSAVRIAFAEEFSR